VPEIVEVWLDSGTDQDQPPQGRKKACTRLQIRTPRFSEHLGTNLSSRLRDDASVFYCDGNDERKRRATLKATEMNYWIFQSTVDRKDLREILREGNEDTRLASRYRQQMSQGDIVYFWLAGPDEIRGIYGWGVLLSDPYLNEDEEEYRVKVRYDKRLRSHIPTSRIKATAELEDLLILRAPQATNFLLSTEEARAIANFMEADERPQI